ncbi:ornithine--oxo-acid transaminase [Streptomyces sp. NPDC002490]|uniref:ornithine--oxo-acid transaminase n=1 Tax=Streptomyces sp. NPDC002490 TaxID=3154416 RepID=UPI00333288D5
MPSVIDLELRHGARNYHPLDVVLESARGAWAVGSDGRRYLDFLAGYSSLNFGHRHPVLIEAARKQLDRLTLTSRAFHHDQLGPFCAELAEMAGKDMVLPMNTGAEAVESAIKVARKWGYEVRGVPADRATIVVAEGNFHGRTTTIVGFSGDDNARAGFGPFGGGFRTVPFGDAAALADAFDETTVAVLVEPVQGEAGVIVPPPDYLPAVRELCTRNGALFIADEIQSGLGRTGRTFACDHWGVVPDVYVLGKALGGGIVPVSAVVADAPVLGVLSPGQHGSTFGGNPMGCAVARAVIGLLKDRTIGDTVRERGRQLAARLSGLEGRGVVAVRCLGLWAGIDIEPSLASGRTVCEGLAERGVLAKDTHGSTLRFAPPLFVTADEVDFAVDALADVLAAQGRD